MSSLNLMNGYSQSGKTIKWNAATVGLFTTWISVFTRAEFSSGLDETIEPLAKCAGACLDFVKKIEVIRL